MKLSTIHIILTIVLILPHSLLAGKKEKADLFNKTGLKFLKSRQYQLAAQCFKSAIKKNSSVKYYYNNFAVASIKLKNYKTAYFSLHIALKLDPAYVKALSNMAIVCFYLNEYREAYYYYRKAMTADKLYISKRFTRKKAIGRLEKLQKQNPKNKTYKKMLNYLKQNNIPK